MEEELKCPECRKFIKEPVLLHCGHSYCRACAVATQVKVSSTTASGSTNTTCYNTSASSSGASDTISLCVSDVDAEADVDKLSVAGSETDSGVVICSSSSSSGGCRNSRPSSFLSGFGGHGPALSSTNILSATPTFLSNQHSTSSLLNTPKIPSILSPSTSGYVLICEGCRKPSFFSDENQLRQVPENGALRRILERFASANPENSGKITNTLTNANKPENAIEKPKVPNCQWCEGDSPGQAKVYCDNCGYFYCDQCQPVIHPSRGPLKDHLLLEASVALAKTNAAKLLNNNGTLISQMGKNLDSATSTEHFCDMHSSTPLSLYCQVCRMAVCGQCLGEVRHTGHEVQTLSSVVKSQKTELSQTLQLLSEKAKNATEEITRLKQLQEKINVNSVAFMKNLDVELDALIELLRSRRQQLAKFVDLEKERKRSALKEQIGRCAVHLNKTTSLVQFCIELLKEPDPISYLQIGNVISNRVTNQEFLWHREMRTKAEINPDFDLTLDIPQIQYAIKNLDFTQHKVPPIPHFEASECSAENNSVVLAWSVPPTGTGIDGFSLEIDSGRNDGMKFTAASTLFVRLMDSILIPSTMLELRLLMRPAKVCTVKPFAYKLLKVIANLFNINFLVAWFQLNNVDSSLESGDLLVSKEFSTVTASTIDYRTILGSVGFSRGVHYWEVSVNRLEGNADIVLGVAQNAVNRKIMLGKDVHGWSTYIDSERSWFLHNDAHHGRLNSGLLLNNGKDCVIGVLMDCDRGQLTFFHNDTLLGKTPAFKNMPHGLYYPAFSVNRQSSISIHTGLPVPLTLNPNKILS